MKRLEITVPKNHGDDVEEVLAEYGEEVTSSEAEKDGKAFTTFQLTAEPDEIDELSEEVKEIKELETGDLTINVLEQTAQIEKGKRREGGTSALSVQEMYSKAFGFATVDRNEWALIGLAVGIAVFGVIMDNIMVVIGAMVIAPLLGPYIALSFGLVIGDRQLIRDSMFYGVISLFFGIAVAFLFGFLVNVLFPVQETAVMNLIADPGFATVPLSLLVGAAAALTFTTEAQEALAGVAVAIALVPPAAVAGMGLAMLEFRLFFDVALVLLTNLTALLLAGSITFKLVGITPSTYYRKKVSEEKLREALAVSVISILLIGGIVGYLSYQDFTNDRVQSDVEQVIDDRFGDDALYQQVSVTSSTVSVELALVGGEHTVQEIRHAAESVTDRDVNVKLIAVDGTVTRTAEQ